MVGGRCAGLRVWLEWLVKEFDFDIYTLKYSYGLSMFLKLKYSYGLNMFLSLSMLLGRTYSYGLKSRLFQVFIWSQMASVLSIHIV